MTASPAPPPPPLRGEPNPRRLLFVLMAVAFLGDTCAMQKALGPSANRPSEQELAELLDRQSMLSRVEDPQAIRRLAAQHWAFQEEQAKIAERFRPFGTAFALLLVAAYTFVLVFGVRGLGWAPGSARALARVSLLVLPARVAVAAVDFAAGRAAQPALRELLLTYLRLEKTALPAEQLAELEQVVATVGPWAPVLASAALALAVCILFHQAARYFQRPEVLAVFEKHGAGRSPGLE